MSSPKKMCRVPKKCVESQKNVSSPKLKKNFRKILGNAVPLSAGARSAPAAKSGKLPLPKFFENFFSTWDETHFFGTRHIFLVRDTLFLGRDTFF